MKETYNYKGIYNRLANKVLGAILATETPVISYKEQNLFTSFNVSVIMILAFN
jgi:hypothetical protein